MSSASQNVYAANSQTYPYVMSVSWSEGSTNIANNTTVISANGSFAGPNISFDSWQTYYLRLYWHDNNTNTDKLFATSAGFTSAGQSYGSKSVSGKITVTHKSDGSLSGYVKLRFDAPGTSGGWSPGTTDLNTKWTACTTIARASSISVSGSQLSSGVSVTIDRKSNSFTHKVEYKFVESDWTTVSSDAATSASFTPPVSLATQIPSAETGALTVRVTTFNGSTQIGDPVTKSINLKVPTNIVPSLSGLSATRINNGVPSSWGIYVKGKSQVKITASGANGAQGSTIVGYSISGPGLSINASSGTSEVLSSTGTLTYTCTVTDTRGRTASKTVSINVVDYTYPNISMSAERCTSDGTKSINGTYLRIVITFSYASVSGKNSIASKSCSCNGVSNSLFASGTAFVLAANCSIGNHYTVSASVKDALGNTATASVEVTTSYRILNVNKNKNGLAIGKFSEKAAFEVNMDSYLYGNVYLPKGIKRYIDSRNVKSTPADYRDVLKFLGLKTSGTTGINDGSYQDVLGFCGWSDNGASGAHELAFSRTGIHYRSESGNNSWGSWGKLAFQSSIDNILNGKTSVIRKSDLLDIIYPVGSVYFSNTKNAPDAIDNLTCPIAQKLGGTWQLVEISIHNRYHYYYVLDIASSKFENNRNVQIYQTNGSSAQRWVIGLWGNKVVNEKPTTTAIYPHQYTGGQGWLCIWVRTA